MSYCVVVSRREAISARKRFQFLVQICRRIQTGHGALPSAGAVSTAFRRDCKTLPMMLPPTQDNRAEWDCQDEFRQMPPKCHGFLKDTA